MSEPNDGQSWYAVRCVFQSDSETVTERKLYEERITLWRAGSFAGAIARAELDADEYARDIGGEYVGLAQAFWLDDEGTVGDGAEVFSLVRQSELSVDEYLDRFFDTRRERQGTIE